MKITINEGVITALGTMDFKGTLAVDRHAPVGLTSLRMDIAVNTEASDESVGKLIELSKRYCVVHQTLTNTVDPDGVQRDVAEQRLDDVPGRRVVALDRVEIVEPGHGAILGGPPGSRPARGLNLSPGWCVLRDDDALVPPRISRGPAPGDYS